MLSDQILDSLAEVITPRLFEVIRERGSVNELDVKRALLWAYKWGLTKRVPRCERAYRRVLLAFYENEAPQLIWG